MPDFRKQSQIPPAPRIRNNHRIVFYSSRFLLVLKALFISRVRPVWVGLALRLDAIGCSEPRFEWVSTAEEALTQLRNDSYDCLLIEIDSETRKSRLELLNAIRISGCREPAILLLAGPDDRVTQAACENQAEVLVSTAMWESPALLSVVHRALSMQQLCEEKPSIAGGKTPASDSRTG